jgi:mono/diheme cytochrome c family protein
MESKVKLRVVAICAPLVFGLLNACHSSDLGSKKPDKINVDLALSSWDGGAGEVITQKCASCHTAQRSKFVPDNTPHELDGIESLDFFKNPENRGIAKSMRKRIESTDATRQMPPKFATPLYEDEKAVVLAFLKSVEAGEVSTNPCKKSLRLTSKQLLKRDHDDDDDIPGQPEPGDDDQAPTTPRPGQGEGSVVVQPNQPDPCSQVPPPSDPENPQPTKVTFSDVAAIVTANCAGCHNGAREFSLQTREDFVAKNPTPLNELLSGGMPLWNPGFKDTADGKLLIQWLQGPQTE